MGVGDADHPLASEFGCELGGAMEQTIQAFPIALECPECRTHDLCYRPPDA
jgi:hypothetical protein